MPLRAVPEGGGCVGEDLIGQVGVVDGAGHGDRADEGAEGQDRVALPSLGVVDEVGDDGEVFAYLLGVGGSRLRGGRGAGR